MRTDYYVYEHWRPDIDKPFYVGKGNGRRANAMYGRNRRHERIQAKLARLGMCVEVRMVAQGLTEIEAFRIECERIVFWRTNGVSLVNLTDGGEGGSNPSDKTRALMRAAKVGRKLTDEHRANIAAGSRAALANPEVREKISRANKAASLRPEVFEKRSRVHRGVAKSAEHKAKISAAHMGKKLSPKHAAKSRLASLGRKQPQDEIERRRAANKGKKRTAEFGERMKALWTPERRVRQAALIAERSAKMNASKKIKEEKGSNQNISHELSLFDYYRDK